MTKTLRVDLADLEGIPHASGQSGTRVVVTAEYTSPVILAADGTIILAPKSKTMGASGRVDFDGIYASDSEDVREDHRGFAVRVKVEIREPNGGTRAWSRTVKPLEYMAETVRLGRMPSAQGLPPQWTTVDELVGDIEAAAGTAEWAGITDKPSTFPPSTHTHDIAAVTGLTEQISGVVTMDGENIPFGPGGDIPTQHLLAATFYTAVNAESGAASAFNKATTAVNTLASKANLATTPGFVTVVSGSEDRPAHTVVFWIGGTAEPVNMVPGDVWLEQ